MFYSSYWILCKVIFDCWCVALEVLVIVIITLIIHVLGALLYKSNYMLLSCFKILLSP